MHFLFQTWLGGVVCSTIALLIFGYPIVNWLAKKKQQVIEKAKQVGHQLHDLNEHARQQSQNQNQR